MKGCHEHKEFFDLRGCEALLLVFLVSLGVGCQSTVKQQSTAVDTSLGQTHPLTGKIFSVADQAFVTEAQLLDALSGADYVLLGEKHDNPIHHQIQAKIVAGLPNLGAVQLEMLTMNKAQRLSSATSEKEFKEASNWQSSGWPGVFNLSDPNQVDL